jgi:hypothetical protein
VEEGGALLNELKTDVKWNEGTFVIVWTSPPKSFMMASPILITMHPAADSDQTAHMVMNMEGVQKRCLCSGEAMDYNISSYYELSVESTEESVCENVPDMYNVYLK